MRHNYVQFDLAKLHAHHCTKARNLSTRRDGADYYFQYRRISISKCRHNTANGLMATLDSNERMPTRGIAVTICKQQFSLIN